MKRTRLDIVEQMQDGDNDGPFALGTVEVPADRLGKATDLVQDLWPAFQATQPDADSEYIAWLIKRLPRLFLREVKQNACVFIKGE